MLKVLKYHVIQLKTTINYVLLALQPVVTLSSHCLTLGRDSTTHTSVYGVLEEAYR